MLTPEKKQEIIEQATVKRDNLKKLSQHLKEHFVGIDEVIDKIIEAIEVWYVMPDLMSRPVIINLWGLTGVGKTDLVRKLVKFLEFGDNFLEIQLTNKGPSNNSYATSLQEILESSNLDSKRTGILLLDEIQRFRTVNEQGNEIHDYKCQDIWGLLSDGQFSGGGASLKERLIELLFDATYDLDSRDSNDDSFDDEWELDDPDEPINPDDPDSARLPVIKRKPTKKRKFKQSYYSARKLSKMLQSNESIESIMQWDINRRIEVVESKLKDKDIFDGDKYGKLLIFISGNIDEAYYMSSDCEEADIDADFFHYVSKRITIVTIKKALKKRFKPEQIARFGNVHIIYPSLSKSSYQEIIKRKIFSISKSIEDNFGIKLKINQSVIEFIYRNGVFPVQGTRPLFSTISLLFESYIPSMLLFAITKDLNDINVSYENNNFVVEAKNETLIITADGTLDQIKKKRDNKDSITKTGVHESGHAAIYALLFGMAPMQLSIGVVSDDSNGFTGSHEISMNNDMLSKSVQVGLGGLLAENIIFGKLSHSSGAISDIEEITRLVASAVRSWGLINPIKIVHQVGDGGSEPNSAFTSIDETNVFIKKFILEQKEIARKLLTDNIAFLFDISDNLIKHKVISQDMFKEICDRNGINISDSDIDSKIISKYSDIYENSKQNLETIGRTPIDHSIDHSIESINALRDEINSMPDEILSGIKAFMKNSLADRLKKK